jgi:hypothetical protein
LADALKVGAVPARANLGKHQIHAGMKGTGNLGQPVSQSEERPVISDDRGLLAW